MALMEVRNLTKYFGGLKANDKISFRVEQGERVGLIGPNGAGKTTLFHCITGFHAVTSGQIVFDGKDVSHCKPHEMARLGLARTFQVYAAGGDLSVKENVMVGCFLHTSSRSRAELQARQLLQDFKIQDLADSPVRDLPVAAQKRVLMATAIGTHPKMLLLDEVAAGLNPTEIEEIMKMIRFIHEDLKVTVLLIEHVMEMVMKICHRVIVLDSGRKIAEDVPAIIAKDPNVIKAYLGERYLREHRSPGS
jgi:branched-chain amino acid transport system ATP-binding protein